MFTGPKLGLKGTSNKMVGWGEKYEEASEDPTRRNPILSSCMTSEASPIKWRFQNCDMAFQYKYSSDGQKRWECEKTNPPPGYENKKHQKRCNGYFKEYYNFKKTEKKIIPLSRPGADNDID